MAPASTAEAAGLYMRNAIRVKRSTFEVSAFMSPCAPTRNDREG